MTMIFCSPPKKTVMRNESANIAPAFMHVLKSKQELELKLKQRNPFCERKHSMQAAKKSNDYIKDCWNIK